MTDTNKIPNTQTNQTKVRQAVAQFMVERVLTKDEIMEFAMDYLEDLYADHTIGDLAAMVKETEIPKARPNGPEQPDHMLCYGSFHNEEPENQYYFFTKEQDYDYSACEVKGVQ
tara:strand:- start:225 stop:566 length:342 start_codon:yes stop_codon:yes gene_type:complete